MHGYGGPEVLEYEEVQTPRPEAGEVLLKVEAVSINRTLDLAVRSGTSPFRVTFPHILGTDPSGIVEAVGPGVGHVEAGQKVAIRSVVHCGECPGCLANRMCTRTRHIGVECWGGYAEYVVVSQAQAMTIPDDVDFADATYIARHFTMATAQVRATEVSAGDTVLVMGAAGALGTLLVQLLTMKGATVIGAAGTDDRVAHVLEYGADYAINYRNGDLTERVMDITGGEGVRVVFENIGDPELWTAAFNSLAFEGELITAGYHGGGVVPLDVRRLHMRRLRVVSTRSPQGGGASPMMRSELVGDGMRLLQGGTIRAAIGARLPLSEAAEAHRLIERRAIPGKLVLVP
jgi:NADPH:quinone reductase-like Zn-dependent oxidoreductase